MNRTALAILSFVLGLLILPVCAYLYLSYGKPPVATADAPFPMEARIVKIPLSKRIDSEMPGAAPISMNDDTAMTGATIYARDCAFCHGLPGKTANISKTMYPNPPQLWVKHKNGVVGVSDDPAGETFWKVKNGIRLTGMPAYTGILSETEMWQVSLLLATADKPLPAATKLLTP
jgi:mono/diheme cytochrome c family protein